MLLSTDMGFANARHMADVLLSVSLELYIIYDDILPIVIELYNDYSLELIMMHRYTADIELFSD